VKEAGTSFIFLKSVVHWHPDLKVLCSNLTVDIQSYLQKIHTLEVFLFCMVY
jgi:hypothetical protein